MKLYFQTRPSEGLETSCLGSPHLTCGIYTLYLIISHLLYLLNRHYSSPKAPPDKLESLGNDGIDIEYYNSEHKGWKDNF